MSNPVEASFDLVERPWVLAQRGDGTVAELSLREVFRRAAELRSVLGEVPTQTFAITRLLLAILRRAVGGPADLAAWGRLWEQPALPVDHISAYLDEFRDRFDLLSPVTPFFQVAGLRTAKGEYSRLDKLIADVPVNAHFFTTRLGPGINRIGFAEAARWVVHCQAFDPSGIKSGAVGDHRVRGGRGYPIGTGWAGMLGGVLVEGQTLRETLLLNLVPAAGQAGAGAGDDDLPVWEREPAGAAPEFLDGHEPAGPIQLLTWQSRRIRLFHDAGGVHGVLIANGDKLAPHNRHTVEPMSAWRRSPNQEKQTGKVPTYLPRPHDPSRSVWRGLAALLQETHAATGKDADAYLRPAVLDRLATARREGALPDDYQVRLRTIGMDYGSQSATTTAVVDDALTLHTVLLGEAGAELRTAAVDAVVDADNAALALGYLAANLAVAAGGEGAGPRDRAKETAYAELDRPYRRWLAGLGPETSPTVARTAWQRAANERVLTLGRSMVESAGPAAWRGRTITNDKKEQHLSTPEADIWFRRALRKHLPYAYSPQKVEVVA